MTHSILLLLISHPIPQLLTTHPLAKLPRFHPLLLSHLSSIHTIHHRLVLLPIPHRPLLPIHHPLVLLLLLLPIHHPHPTTPLLPITLTITMSMSR